MAPQRVHKAMTAMKAIGIPYQTVKPVLKRLLKTYENNWELIEDENYRVLADAIFDAEESMREEDKTEDTSKTEASDYLRKRHRLRQEDQSLHGSDVLLADSSSKRQKLSDSCFSETHSRQVKTEPISPEARATDKSAEPFRGERYVTGSRSGSISLPTIGIEQNFLSTSSHIATQAKRTVPYEERNRRCLKKPKVEPDIESFSKTLSSIHQSSTELFSSAGQCSQDEVLFTMVDPHLQILPCREDHTITVKKKGSCFLDDSTVVELPNDGKDKSLHPICKNGASHELVNVPDKSTNIEIASTSSGEVKLSLNYDSLLYQSGFHVPSLEEVLKLVEDRCLKSYRIVESKFSFVKLMQEFCQCFLDLATDSNGERQETHINITSELDLLKEFNLKNVFCAKVDHLQCHPTVPAKFSNNDFPGIHCDSGEAAPVPKSQALEFLHYHSQLNQRGSTNSNCDWDKKKGIEGLESSTANLHNSVALRQSSTSYDGVKPIHDVNDITKGEEGVQITVINDVSSECYPPSFYYIPHNIVYQNAYINFSLARIGDENCCSDCFGDCLSASIPCACARETGGEYAYTLDGLIKKEFLDECISMNCDPQKHRLFYCNDCPLERTKNEVHPEPCKGHLVGKFIKECWSKCGCSRQCGNRVVQRGITCNLQVFFTCGGKGWGLRTLQKLPKGTFVCEYVGEILTNMELYDRTIQTTRNDKHTYPVLLDADWGSEGVLKDEEALCLDATFYGNVARFINHRCFDANLIEIPVEVETPDHHYYHLAFFTRRDVQALEELTWDYGIDFDDHNHPIKAFRCCCGSHFCRDSKRSRRSKSTTSVSN